MIKETISGADSLVLMLKKFGVKHIFGVCGDTSLPFYDSLWKLGDGITHILAEIKEPPPTWPTSTRD